MSLFGNNTTSTTGGLFGSKSTATTTTPASGSLFGAKHTTTTAPASSGLFGLTNTVTTTAPALGGLFGSTATTTTTAPATGGLFGTAAAKPATGGLFGSNIMTAVNSTAAKPSLFGNTTSNSTMNAPAATGTTGGLFGSATTSAPAAATSGLFGSTASTTQNATQLQQGNSLHLNMNEVRGTTKFEDLSKDAQDGIIKIDNIISVIMGWKAEIDGFLPGHEEQITSLGHDVAYLERKYAMVKRAVLEEDVANIQELRTMSNKNIADAQLVTKAVDNLKLPASYHVPGLWTQSTAPSASPAVAGEPDLISYFNHHIESLSERERKLRGYIAEIQGHMPRVEHGLYEKLTQMQTTPGMSHQAGTLEQIKGVLLDLRGAIMKQAVEVAKTREALMTLEQKMVSRERY